MSPNSLQDVQYPTWTTLRQGSESDESSSSSSSSPTRLLPSYPGFISANMTSSFRNRREIASNTLHWEPATFTLPTESDSSDDESDNEESARRMPMMANHDFLLQNNALLSSHRPQSPSGLTQGEVARDAKPPAQKHSTSLRVLFMQREAALPNCRCDYKSYHPFFAPSRPSWFDSPANSAVVAAVEQTAQVAAAASSDSTSSSVPEEASTEGLHSLNSTTNSQGDDLLSSRARSSFQRRQRRSGNFPLAVRGRRRGTPAGRREVALPLLPPLAAILADYTTTSNRPVGDHENDKYPKLVIYTAPETKEDLLACKKRIKLISVEKKTEEKKDDDGCDDCPICFVPLNEGDEHVAMPKCRHEFHRSCIEKALDQSETCPICRQQVVVASIGTMPSGTMRVARDPFISCTGYEHTGTIIIDYCILAGKQRDYHPIPGQVFKRLQRRAYLPDTPEGQKLEKRLECAFLQGQTFEFDYDYPLLECHLEWTLIPHKTIFARGSHGYPDNTYFDNANLELDFIGIPPADELMRDGTAAWGRAKES